MSFSFKPTENKWIFSKTYTKYDVPAKSKSDVNTTDENDDDDDDDESFCSYEEENQKDNSFDIDENSGSSGPEVIKREDSGSSEPEVIEREDSSKENPGLEVIEKKDSSSFLHEVGKRRFVVDSGSTTVLRIERVPEVKDKEAMEIDEDFIDEELMNFIDELFITATNDEDLLVAVINNLILEVCFECHRAAKLGYMSGNLGIFFYKKPEQSDSNEPLKKETAAKKKKKVKKGTSHHKDVICLICGYPSASNRYGKHLAKHFKAGNTRNRGVKMDYCEKTMAQKASQATSDKTQTTTQAKQKRKKTTTQAKQTPKKTTTQAKQKRKKTTNQGKVKGSQRKVTYQDLSEMSMEGKEVFFSQNCGVKLKHSKFATLCAKAIDSCQVHSDDERENIRLIHLNKPTSGTYEHCC